MANFEHYLILYVYPIALFVFVVGSLLAFRNRKDITSLSLLVGFSMVLIGNLIKNYGPSEVTYMESGNAIVKFTFLFNLGTYLGLIGILVANVSGQQAAIICSEKPL